jgi:hypothetical protein
MVVRRAGLASAEHIFTRHYADQTIHKTIQMQNGADFRLATIGVAANFAPSFNQNTP